MYFQTGKGINYAIKGDKDEAMLLVDFIGILAIIV